MLKRNVFKILAIVFFLLSATTFYYSNKETQNIINVQTPKLGVSKNLTSNILGREDRAPTISVRNGLKPFPTYDTGILHNTPTVIPTQIIIQPTNSTNSDYRLPITDFPTQTPTPYTLPTTTLLSVSLSIAGSSVGSFEIPEGSNQCDLLTQALSQGKIQSLNMRYNSDMGTNAVYQINGIGKENAVWWGFKVNGQSPSQGCSYIKVNNGDSVLWEYVGN